MTEDTKIILERLDQMDSKIDQLDSRMDQMDSRMDKMDSRIDQLDSRMDQMDSKIDKMDSRINTLDAKTDTFNSRMDTVEIGIDEVKSQITGIELILENEIRRNIQIIAEGHLDLSRKLDDAIKVKEEREMLLMRTNVLESDVRMLKDKVNKLSSVS